MFWLLSYSYQFGWTTLFGLNMEIKITNSLFLPEPTTEVTPQAPSPLPFFLKPRTTSSSSRPALPSHPPQPLSALLQSGLPWCSRARREQGALWGEQLRPGEEPQAQLPPPRTDRVQLARFCSTESRGCSVHPRTVVHQTRPEWTHLYTCLPHQDAKPQRPEGDRAVKLPNHTTSNMASSWKHLQDADIVL